MLCYSIRNSKKNESVADVLSILCPDWFQDLNVNYLACDLLTPVVMFHQDVLEGGNLRAPLQELHQMIMTPIKAFSGSEETSPQRPLLSPEGKSAAPGSHLSSSGGVEAESGTSVIAEGDLTGQFTRVMGKGELYRPGLGCRLFLFAAV